MKAEQYLIKHNLDKTYWGKKIIAAEKRGWFTNFNSSEAGNWVTCACGRLDKRLHDYWGVPEDEQLRVLGYEFSAHINSDNFYLAAVTLNKIEKRAAIVLRSVA